MSKTRMITPPEHRFLNTMSARVCFIVRANGKIDEENFKLAVKKAHARALRVLTSAFKPRRPFFT